MLIEGIESSNNLDFVVLEYNLKGFWNYERHGNLWETAVDHRGQFGKFYFSSLWILWVSFWIKTLEHA